MSSFLSFNQNFLNSDIMDDLSHDFTHKTHIHEKDVINAEERLEALLRQVDDVTLSSMMQNEFQHMVIDHERLVTMLEQRSRLLENENNELKVILNDSQRRYEKAVREMQFFKKKYDRLVETTVNKHADMHTPKPSPTQLPSGAVNFTPSSSPQPSSIADSSSSSSVYSHHHPEKLNWPISPTSISMESSATRRSNQSNTPSVYGGFSSNSETTSYSHQPHHRYDDHHKKPTGYQFSRNPSMVSSYSSPSHAPSMISGSSSVTSAPPLTPVRSCTSTAGGYIGNSIIQQRRTDPLTFGGSDALWDTISKSQGNDMTVEKIISNFLRRGGSPNTAKQSPSAQNVKYGYGMIHALIVTKASGALDLLLQQGANPNVVSISQVDDEKVSPCYLAASIGWLAGLQKLVQAGGDLMSARGGGNKKKTPLHTAAEHGHAATVEYIVNMTHGVLNLEIDSMGANTLHYACASGHTELVSFIIKVCHVPVDELDFRGESPLHWATRNGRFEVVTLLIDRYRCAINPFVTKKLGTPYDLAKSGGHKRLAEYIKNNGGLTAKKMDKKREEELSEQIPTHLEAALAKNGFFSGI